MRTTDVRPFSSPAHRNTWMAQMPSLMPISQNGNTFSSVSYRDQAVRPTTAAPSGHNTAVEEGVSALIDNFVSFLNREVEIFSRVLPWDRQRVFQGIIRRTIHSLATLKSPAWNQGAAPLPAQVQSPAPTYHQPIAPLHTQIQVPAPTYHRPIVPVPTQVQIPTPIYHRPIAPATAQVQTPTITCDRPIPRNTGSEQNLSQAVSTTLDSTPEKRRGRPPLVSSKATAATLRKRRNRAQAKVPKEPPSTSGDPPAEHVSPAKCIRQELHNTPAQILNNDSLQSYDGNVETFVVDMLPTQIKSEPEDSEINLGELISLEDLDANLLGPT
jgi:hypothetical protein